MYYRDTIISKIGLKITNLYLSYNNITYYNDKIILLLQKAISIKDLELSLTYNFKIMSSGVKLYF